MATTDLVYGAELTNIRLSPSIKPGLPWPGANLTLVGTRTTGTEDREIRMVQVEPGDWLINTRMRWEALGANSTASIGDAGNCANIVAAFRTDVASDNAAIGVGCSNQMKIAKSLTQYTAETYIVVASASAPPAGPFTAAKKIQLFVEIFRPGAS